MYFREIGERGLVAIATSGLFSRIAVDLASGHVVHISHVESSKTYDVNATSIAHFPFFAEGDQERWDEVAEALRELVSGTGGTALADSGFWETFCDEVAIEAMQTGMHNPNQLPALFSDPGSDRRPLCSRRGGHCSTGFS